MGGGGVLRGGADHRPLSPSCSHLGAAAGGAGAPQALPGRGQGCGRLAQHTPLPATFPRPPAAGPGRPLATLAPSSSRHCPRSGRVLAPAASSGPQSPARGFIYIVPLVAASPCRGRRGSARLPLLAVGVPPRFRAEERVGELRAQVSTASAPTFLGAKRASRRREGWQ